MTPQLVELIHLRIMRKYLRLSIVIVVEFRIHSSAGYEAICEETSLLLRYIECGSSSHKSEMFANLKIKFNLQKYNKL
jgi:hypothetical protein